MKKLDKNKTTVSAREAIAEVLETLEELKCDPIRELATIAMAKTTLQDDKIVILKELANYVAPKRKAVDVNLESQDGITVRIIKVNSPKAGADEMFKDTKKPKDNPNDKEA